MTSRTNSTRRSIVAGSRRSMLPAADDKGDVAGPSSPAPRKRTSSEGSSSGQAQGESAAKRVKLASDEATRIISTYDADSQSHHIHQLLRAFASKQTQRTPRASISSSSALYDGADHHGWNPVDVEWTIFQDWPQGLEQEEREMKQYYKYLKFIHLEHETKIRFITEIVDDLTADPPREAVVYTSRDVKEHEASMFALKAQLKEAKTQVRALRDEIDAIATRLATPYKQLTSSCVEAKTLLDECMDLELELVKLRSRGIAGSASSSTSPAMSSADQLQEEIDVESMDLEVLPPVGTLTAEEADRFCERQEEALAQVEESNANLDTLMNQLKNDTKTAIKAVDRLSSENHTAEKLAREAQQLGVGGKKRDKEVERICASHSATLALLKSLVGLKSAEAPTETQLKLVYLVPSVGCELGIKLNFAEPGGRLVTVELDHALHTPVTVPTPKDDKNGASTESAEFATLLRAVKANDLPAVIMEAWDWAARKGEEEEAF